MWMFRSLRYPNAALRGAELARRGFAALVCRRAVSSLRSRAVKESHQVLERAAHPLAGRTLSGAEIIIQVLADEGADAIFGYSGGAILPTYDAVFLYNQGTSSGVRAADAADRSRQ